MSSLATGRGADAVVLKSLVLTLLPAVASTVCLIVATHWSPNASTRVSLQHFAAGVMFAVVGADLLPHIMNELTSLEVTIAFSAGVAVTLALRRLTHRAERARPDEVRA